MKTALGLAIGNQNKEEFVREMHKWELCLRKQGWCVVTHTQNKGKVDAAFLHELMADPEYDLVAIFCHGYPRRIQWGLDADTLQRLVGRNTLVLYCCSTARQPGKKPRFDSEIETKGSYAHCVASDPLWSTTPHVYAHTTSGHTTRNPYTLSLTREYEPEWVIEPKSGKEWKAWRNWLTKDGRFLFPIWGLEKTRRHIAFLAGITYEPKERVEQE